MRDRAKEAAKEEVKDLIPPGVKDLIEIAGGFDTKSSTPLSVPDANTTNPTVSTDGNTTQSTGKQSASELSWMVVTDENGTIKNAAFHCN